MPHSTCQTLLFAKFPVPLTPAVLQPGLKEEPEEGMEIYIVEPCNFLSGRIFFLPTLYVLFLGMIMVAR